MKKFSTYIKENQSNNILVIVDVQKEFNKFIPQGYVSALINYAKTFKTVYQIWDSNDDQTKPSYDFGEVESIKKKFGTKFSDELVQTVDELNKKYPNAKEGDIFEFDDVNSYVVRIKNHHSWFYVTENLAKLFNSLKGKNVTVVGGAKGECIQDVFEAMESFGVKVK